MIAIDTLVFKTDVKPFFSDNVKDIPENGKNLYFSKISLGILSYFSYFMIYKFQNIFVISLKLSKLQSLLIYFKV